MNFFKVGIAISVAILANWSVLANAEDERTGRYQELIEQSKTESGLIVYSNMPDWMWKPFRNLLSERYPWVRLQTTDLGGELWERYYAEASANTRTADIITTGAPDRWLDFADRGEVLAYQSIEDPHLPEWSRPKPGLYTLAVNPAIIIWNRFQVKTPPKTLVDLAAMARETPEILKGKITTYDAAASPFGVAMFATWLRGEGNNWETLKPIGLLARPETGAGAMRDKTASGEYSIGFFAASAGIPKLEEPAMKQLVGYDYIYDGTPVSLQGIAVTKHAASPNTAKIVMDLMLSRQGQIAFAQGGFTAYRDDVDQADVPYPTLGTVRQKVGEKNILFNSYDRGQIRSWPAVTKAWRAVFGRP